MKLETILTDLSSISEYWTSEPEYCVTGQFAVQFDEPLQLFWTGKDIWECWFAVDMAFVTEYLMGCMEGHALSWPRTPRPASG